MGSSTHHELRWLCVNNKRSLLGIYIPVGDAKKSGWDSENCAIIFPMPVHRSYRMLCGNLLLKLRAVIKSKHYGVFVWAVQTVFKKLIMPNPVVLRYQGVFCFSEN